MSLKFVPKCPINNIPALVQIMAWRRPGDKPLSEPMMVSLPTHICATRSQWVNGPPMTAIEYFATSIALFMIITLFRVDQYKKQYIHIASTCTLIVDKQLIVVFYDYVILMHWHMTWVPYILQYICNIYIVHLNVFEWVIGNRSCFIQNLNVNCCSFRELILGLSLHRHLLFSFITGIITNVSSLNSVVNQVDFYQWFQESEHTVRLRIWTDMSANGTMLYRLISKHPNNTEASSSSSVTTISDLPTAALLFVKIVILTVLSFRHKIPHVYDTM